MNLDELRAEIDRIDKDMMELFKKRMHVSFLIGQYKKEHQLPVLDLKRESELLEKRKQTLHNDALWPLYKEFIQEVMRLSKVNQQ
jgi:monofunctional chorismate mutase